LPIEGCSGRLSPNSPPSFKCKDSEVIRFACCSDPSTGRAKRHRKPGSFWAKNSRSSPKAIGLAIGLAKGAIREQYARSDQKKGRWFYPSPFSISCALCGRLNQSQDWWTNEDYKVTSKFACPAWTVTVRCMLASLREPSRPWSADSPPSSFAEMK